MARKVYQAIIDIPIGYQDSFGNRYPINYGYIPNLFAEDGEEQYVYIASELEPYFDSTISLGLVASSHQSIQIIV